MGLLSPYTLIRTLSLFHLTAAWFFLSSPNTIADQNVVFMLGESMGLVSKATQPKSPTLQTQPNTSLTPETATRNHDAQTQLPKRKTEHQTVAQEPARSERGA